MKILIRSLQRRRSLNNKRIRNTAGRILSILKQQKAELSILFVGDRKMKQLNTEYRGIRKTTDVLSFPQINENPEVRSKKLPSVSNFSLPASHVILGDIVICVSKAESQAKTSGLGFYEEINRLLVHGTLHLLGYDHEGSEYETRKMRKKEEELIDAVKKVD